MTKKKSEWFFGLSGKANLVISLVFVLVFCFLDQLIPGKTPVIPNFVKYIAVNGLIYAIASLGINFYSGYLGETSLGHAAFYGIGAYMTGYLTTKFGVNFWLALPLGMLAAAAGSVPVALADPSWWSSPMPSVRSCAISSSTRMSWAELPAFQASSRRQSSA